MFKFSRSDVISVIAVVLTMTGVGFAAGSQINGRTIQNGTSAQPKLNQALQTKINSIPAPTRFFVVKAVNFNVVDCNRSNGVSGAAGWRAISGGYTLSPGQSVISAGVDPSSPNLYRVEVNSEHHNNTVAPEVWALCFG